jgi:MauM/NapG family ferredoxin protein
LKKERSKKYRALQLLRILSQVVFFGVFLRLLFETHYTGQDYINKPVEAFFHFDPLLALATTIASRAFFAAFALAGVTIVLTLLAGRFVCGWVCPLGSLHQFFSWVFKRARLLKPRKEDGTRARLAWKYYILTAVLAGSLLAVDLAGIADPLSFLYRSFATGVVPWFSRVGAAFTGLVYAVKLGSLGDALAQLFGTLSLNATFRLGFFLSLMFAGAVLLNISRERFWCRYLCPAGALLGLLSRRNIGRVRIDEAKCIKCNLCTLQCQTQANPYPNESWRSSECVYCYTCAAVCPTNAVRFPVAKSQDKAEAVNLSRRRLLLTTGVSLIAAPFFKITPAGKRASARLLRPPGALPEPQFLDRCVKCGECMKACPTNALQPALEEAGPEGLWTPVLVPRIGYCEYYCSLCSQVCPTGAIKELTIEEKAKVKIGSAWVNKSRCIPYVFGRPCIVCEEHCPTSPKAIKLIKTETKLPDGTVLTPLAPVLDLDLCIGCGICENKCPVVDDPAIFCTSAGETRSEKNRLLLEVNQPAGTPGEDPYK